MPAHALLIHNSGAGSSGAADSDALIAALSSPDCLIKLHALQEGEKADEIAAAAIEQGAKWIAVAGGDGTVEAVARAMIGTNVPLGVIPAGTYNNFALSLDLPKESLEAAALIRAGKVKKIDVGFANSQPFFECAGAGLDAALFPLGEEIKGGSFLRWFTFLRRAWTYPKQRFELTFDRPVCDALVSKSHGKHYRKLRSKTLRVSALMVTASNGPYYGMNFTVAPGARIDDGLITVNVFKRYNKLELWWHFFSISFGRRGYSPKAITFRAGRLEIGGSKRQHTHLDGNPSKEWPLKIECRPGALQVFAS